MACGLVYLRGGTVKMMEGAINNMAGSITGMICDGGNQGCTMKGIVAVDAAYQSAELAMDEVCVANVHGIVGRTPEETMRNMGEIASPGMIGTREDDFRYFTEKGRQVINMYQADKKRYEGMKYNRCGKSGLKLPEVSLGLWHNFGDTGNFENMKRMCFTAFDHGITHFDVANNYGPEPGSAEVHLGRILKEEMGAYRDELIISTKAGYLMWDGPYGDWGSRKYVLASLDQSLKRMGLEYVDIFYHHRMDRRHRLRRQWEHLTRQSKVESIVCRDFEL